MELKLIIRLCDKARLSFVSLSRPRPFVNRPESVFQKSPLSLRLVPGELTSLQIHFKKMRDFRGSFPQMKPCRCKSFSSFQIAHDTVLTLYLQYLLHSTFHSHYTHPMQFTLYKGEQDDFFLPQASQRESNHRPRSAEAKWRLTLKGQ